MRFSIAPSSIDSEICTILIVKDLLEFVSKFRKPLSSHVEPFPFVIYAINFEPPRHPAADEREGQFCVEGRIGKLDDRIGARNDVFGRRNG